MVILKKHIMVYKRKRLGRTNYRKRLQLLHSPHQRFVVRKTLYAINVQLIGYGSKGDKILSLANSRELKPLGWPYQLGCLPAAYLTGYLAGKKSLQAHIHHANLDLGLYPAKKGSKIFAALKGASDAGLNIPCQASMFPSEDRIKGKHIKAYAAMLKDAPVQFHAYRDQGVDLAAIEQRFELVKKKIDETYHAEKKTN